MPALTMSKRPGGADAPASFPGEQNGKTRSQDQDAVDTGRTSVLLRMAVLRNRLLLWPRSFSANAVLLNTATLVGRSIIGFRDGGEVSEHFYGVNPANGQRLQPGFSPASAGDVEPAAQLAVETFAVYRRSSGQAGEHSLARRRTCATLPI